MNYHVELGPQAKAELAHQITYYELQSPGLGIRFAAEVTEILSTLSRIPYAHVRYSDIRCVPMKRFPLMVHFRVNQESRKVLVYGMIHSARNPNTSWDKNDWTVSESIEAYADLPMMRSSFMQRNYQAIWAA